MARRALLLLLLATFVSASRAQAAAIDITVSLVPGSNTWYLRIDSTVLVSGLTLAIPEAFSFTPLVPPPPVGCVCLPPTVVDGFKALEYFPSPPTFPLPPIGNGVLGTLSGPVGSALQVLPGEHVFSDGSSFFDEIG